MLPRFAQPGRAACACGPVDRSSGSLSTELQTRILGWVATSFSGASWDPGVRPGLAFHVCPCVSKQALYHWRHPETLKVFSSKLKSPRVGRPGQAPSRPPSAGFKRAFQGRELAVICFTECVGDLFSLDT